VLLVHGAGQTSASLSRLAGELADVYTVYVSIVAAAFVIEADSLTPALEATAAD
jgi:hypothetical protein